MSAEANTVVGRPVQSATAGGFSQFLSGGFGTCAPSTGNEHHDLHWLAYVADAPSFPFRTTCELWRWCQGEWRSVFVPGSRFTASELHDQGWRYCKPCDPLVAVVRS